MKVKNLVKWYNDKPLPLKATLWFTACSFLQRGISMITTPIFTRVLSTEEYGIYSTYISWNSVLTLVVTLSLYKAMMNLYVKYKDYENVLSSIISLELIVSFIWLVIVLLFKQELAVLLKLPEDALVCMFICFVFQSTIQCWAMYKRYVYDYRPLIVETLLLTLGSSFLGVFLVLFVSATASNRILATTIITVIIGVIIYISVFRKSRTFFWKDTWKFALSFCIVLLPHYLSEFVLQSSDKLMINYICNSTDVALYSVAYSVGSLINLFTNAINSSFAPYQYQKIEARDYKALAKRADQVLFFVSVILLGLMLFSYEIVLFFGGTKYLESVEVIIPICIGVFFNYVFQLFARVQEYFEKKIWVVIPSILCALLNLILNFIFIGIYGYKAAAYTTFVSYMVFCIVHYFFYKQTCKQMIGGAQIYNVKHLIMISAFALLASLGIGLISNLQVIKYVLISCIAIILIIKRDWTLKQMRSIMKN